MSAENDLKAELDQLLQSDSEIGEFVRDTMFDSLAFQNLENPAQTWISPAFWQRIGHASQPELQTARAPSDFVFPEDAAVASQEVEAHCADPDHPIDHVQRFRHANGSGVWFRCRARAVRNDAGHPIRMVAIYSDLTQLKQAEENARAAWRAAENANAELKSFAYAMSQTFKAPTNTLQLLLEELRTLKDGHLGDDGQEILSVGLATVDRMQKQIDNVLDYTRVISTEHVFESVPLGKCAEVAIADLMPDIRASGAEINVGALPQVTAVASQMTMFFKNLISNAIKHRKRDVPLVLRISADEDPGHGACTIDFADNGIGIAPKNHKRIFDIFQRCHAPDDGEGAGLGLPMCHRIVLNHRGHLKVDSHIGSGATFTVSLPRPSY